MSRPPPTQRLRRGLARIWVRLLAFNLLLVFLLAAALLFLDTAERHLLAAQERTMVQEGRLLAAAIEAHGALDASHVERILIQLSQRHEARLRVLDADGRPLADSARLGPRRGRDEPVAASHPARDSLLYQLGSLPFRLLRGAPEDAPGVAADRYDRAEVLAGPEIQTALAGAYGSATRVGGEGEPMVTLYSALPVLLEGRSVGAVLVSQSTDRVLRTLDAIRLDIFRVVLASIAVAVLLSIVVATTIVRPVARLRARAEAILDRRGRLRGAFEPSRRRDEIGDLERALAELTRRLEAHLRATECFAADLSHEFRNPLASIRTATEVLAELEDPAERQHFLSLVQRELARMERLLAATREISRLDAGLEDDEAAVVSLDEILPTVVEGYRLRLGGSGPHFELTFARQGLAVEASPERLTQALEKILDNAVSFSPPGGRVEMTVASAGDQVVMRIADQGPGLPPGPPERLFARFFSDRPGGRAGGGHLGLGLALARAIVESLGGSIEAAGGAEGGAIFTVRLPAHVTTA